MWKMNLEFRVLCLDNMVVFPAVICSTFPLMGVTEKGKSCALVFLMQSNLQAHDF